MNHLEIQPLSAPTCEEAAQKWLNAIQSARKYSTFIRYQYIYEVRIQPILGDICINQINSDRIFSCIMANPCLKGSPPSPGFVRDTLFVLSQIFEFASADKSVKELTKNFILPAKKTSRVETLTRKEQLRLVQVLQKNMDPCKIGILLCLMTGLRLGEICALRTEDIHLDEKYLYVRATVQRLKRPADYDDGFTHPNAWHRKTMLIVSDPKSAHSQRSVPIADTLLPALRTLHSDREYLLNGDRLMDPRTYEYKFARYQEEAGIPHKKFHVLRHTFATNCIAQGMSAKVLSEILGHANVNITLNRYVHPSDETKREQLNRAINDLNIF